MASWLLLPRRTENLLLSFCKIFRQWPVDTCKIRIVNYTVVVFFWLFPVISFKNFL